MTSITPPILFTTAHMTHSNVLHWGSPEPALDIPMVPMVSMESKPTVTDAANSRTITGHVSFLEASSDTVEMGKDTGKEHLRSRRPRKRLTSAEVKLTN
jgi:hypothetical protein